MNSAQVVTAPAACCCEPQIVAGRATAPPRLPQSAAGLSPPDAAPAAARCRRCRSPTPRLPQFAAAPAAAGLLRFFKPAGSQLGCELQLSSGLQLCGAATFQNKKN
jgi:hypothetical protein